MDTSTRAKIRMSIDWRELNTGLLQEILRDPVALACSLQNRGLISIVTTDGIIPPPDGRIHVVIVPVDEGRQWKDAVGAVGPDTPPNRPVWKRDKQFPPIDGATQSLQPLILANFGEKRTRGEDILAWGKDQKLIPISPRAAFAVGEHCPMLNRHIGAERFHEEGKSLDFTWGHDRNLMTVVSLSCLSEGKQEGMAVWWTDSKREAGDCQLVGVESGQDDWFGFTRESK